jgi:predicted amidophosphoribosyltransferase
MKGTCYFCQKRLPAGVATCPHCGRPAKVSLEQKYEIVPFAIAMAAFVGFVITYRYFFTT